MGLVAGRAHLMTLGSADSFLRVAFAAGGLALTTVRLVTSRAHAMPGIDRCFDCAVTSPTRGIGRFWLVRQPLVAPFTLQVACARRTAQGRQSGHQARLTRVALAAHRLVLQLDLELMRLVTGLAVHGLVKGVVARSS